MAISNGQLRTTEGQMKQFGELLEGKTFFRSRLWGNETVRQLDTESRTYGYIMSTEYIKKLGLQIQIKRQK